jgi:hypothetical protein
MRILNIVSGVAVLFTTLAYVHLVHHHFRQALAEAHHSAPYWAAFLPALAAGILSLLGGILLLKRPG